MVLSGRRILLGVGGGIAAYKAPELVRRLQDAGADVWVVVTRAATEFVSPLALQVVSGHPVGQELFSADAESRIVHTDWGKDADLILLAPATADLIGKIRHGLANDLLTTTVMACQTPVLVCPSMNTEMLHNPLVAANIAALQAPEVLGRYTMLTPDEGLLACGVVGPGRQPDPPVLIEACAAVLTPKDLTGVRATVTAGPTHQPLDPVRFVGNRSTGTMGTELARALAARGAEVTLVMGPGTGPHQARNPVGVARRVDVTTAAEMHQAVTDCWDATDVLVMAAAVADYTPKTVAADKIKKGSGGLQIALERTVDILSDRSQARGRAAKVLVGFAAESTDVLKYAEGKLAAKGLDAIVANDISAAGSGFGAGSNAGWLLAPGTEPQPLPQQPKAVFAANLAQRLAPLIRKRLGASA